MAEITIRTQSCCYLATPDHVRSFVGRFIYIYTDKGQLSLTEDFLQFVGKSKIPIEIPLGAITNISVGRYSRWAKPLGLNFMAVRYLDDGADRTVLFTPTRSWATPTWETNTIVAEWIELLHDARRRHAERTVAPDRG